MLQNFSLDWTSTQLGAVGKLIRGVTYGKDDVRAADDVDSIPILRATNIQEGTLNVNDELVYVKGSKIIPAQLLQVGDIVIAMSSGSKSVVGKAGQLRQPWTGAFGAFCGVFRPLSSVDSQFVGYIFQTQVFRSHIEKVARGTNINNLSKEHIEGFNFRLPPPQEQKAIVRVVRAVQEALESRQRELNLERERKSALMQHLFNYGTRSESRKKTEIGELPHSWQVIEVRDGCDIIVDCPHSTPKFRESGVLVARNFNIRNGKFVSPPAFYTSEEEYQQRIKRCTPEAGDILFSREAPVGEACLIPPNSKLSLGQRMMLLRTIKSKLNGYFLVQAFYSESVRPRMLALASGVTAKHLNVADVKRLKVPLPSVEEQLYISEVLQACEDKIDALDRETRLLDELFKAMLEELITGKLSALPLVEAGVGA
jgi:type I restriction enzyme, S subunit